MGRLYNINRVGYNAVIVKTKDAAVFAAKRESCLEKASVFGLDN